MECFLCVLIAFAIPVGISLIFGIIKAFVQGTAEGIGQMMDEDFNRWDKKHRGNGGK